MKRLLFTIDFAFCTLLSCCLRLLSYEWSNRITCKSVKICLHLFWSWFWLTITTMLLYCLDFWSSFMSLSNRMPSARILYWHSNNSTINSLCKYKHIFVDNIILFFHNFFTKRLKNLSTQVQQLHFVVNFHQFPFKFMKIASHIP